MATCARRIQALVEEQGRRARSRAALPTVATLYPRMDERSAREHGSMGRTLPQTDMGALEGPTPLDPVLGSDERTLRARRSNDGRGWLLSRDHDDASAVRDRVAKVRKERFA